MKTLQLVAVYILETTHVARTIRLRPTAYRSLKQIARTTHQSLEKVLERAIDNLERRLYLDGLSQDYSTLNSDPKASAEFRRELERWDVTNTDGLEDL